VLTKCAQPLTLAGSSHGHGPAAVRDPLFADPFLDVQLMAGFKGYGAPLPFNCYLLCPHA
jgi:hypothetical protein